MDNLTASQLERILAKRRRRLGGSETEISHRDLYNEVFGKHTHSSRAYDYSSSTQFVDELALSKYRNDFSGKSTVSDGANVGESYKPSFLKSMLRSSATQMDLTNILADDGVAYYNAHYLLKTGYKSVFSANTVRSLFSDDAKMSDAAGICLSEKDKDRRVIEVIRNYI